MRVLQGDWVLVCCLRMVQISRCSTRDLRVHGFISIKRVSLIQGVYSMIWLFPLRVKAKQKGA
jgi:hypothetical protein